MPADSWKLQDAKARFSEVVRRARSGAPQEVTVHGKKAVAVVDLERFEIRPRRASAVKSTGFAEATRKYRLDVDFDFDRPVYMRFPSTDISGEK